jgi:hypothetical protein
LVESFSTVAVSLIAETPASIDVDVPLCASEMLGLVCVVV